MAGNSPPYIEPDEVTAGDTVQWYMDLTDYLPADGWVLTYKLVNAAGNIDITASSNGTLHYVNVAASSTANWAAGEYKWQSYVTSGADRFSLATGVMTVNANFAAQTTFDARSAAEITLDAINATLQSKASSDQLSMSIGGRSLSRMTFEELIKAKSAYEGYVRNERNADKVARGLSSGNKVMTRFLN